MRYGQYLRWELLLAVTLVGCSSVVPGRVGLPDLTRNATSQGPGTGGNYQAAHTSELFLSIRWPEQAAYNAQTIPSETTKLTFTVLAKDGHTVVGPQDVNRPSTETKSNVSLKVPTSLGVVDLRVEAKKADGGVVAIGEALNILLRDNTATGVSVVLKANASAIEVRQDRQLVLLKDLKSYVERFNHLPNYGRTEEYKDIAAAADALFKHSGLFYSSQPSTTIGYASAPYRIIQATMEHMVMEPLSATRSVDILGSELQKLYWPGYQLGMAFTGGAPTHTLDLTFNPDATYGPSDGSLLKAHGELTAGSWLSEPLMCNDLTGFVAGNPATRSIVLFGGERPDLATITAIRANGYLDPKGNLVKRVGGEAFVDRFGDVTASEFYKVMLDMAATTSLPVTSVPLRGHFLGFTPSMAATADLNLADNLAWGNLRTEAKIKDKFASPANFSLEATASPRFGLVAGKRAIVGVDLEYALTDRIEQLRVEGTAEVALSPVGYHPLSKVKVFARVIDVPSGDRMAWMDYDMPIGPDGYPDVYRSAYWPTLHFKDGTEHHFTPGFFTGESTGSVSVGVW